ncbi:Npun_F0296 family exosortase-dependent surface protein [Sphingobium sp. CR28]|uniref:Npun_F0296 family exosortase-dependent surface protein n=1 Tax=Sphingobium sp. CR28 TaxID=3400272 RepID=UPI003FEEB8D1
MKYLWASAAIAAAIVGTSAAQADTFNVTIEAPTVQNSTAGFSFSGKETFNSRSTGNNQSFVTDFGTGGVITGTYTGVDILAANQYGGAGGSGNFASTATTSGFSLSLSTTNSEGINYFGFWLSALDSGNTLTFSKAGTTLFTFTPSDVLAMVSGLPAYFGNPDSPFTGNNSAQPYAFLNFYNVDGTFDKVTFSESPTVGGYESDNHTVGFFTEQGGTPIPAVPEPATWAMMIAGFGLVGSALRRRVSKVALSHA